MSSIAVQGGATGTGTVTLLAPSTSTNRTLTLPDRAATLLSDDGAGRARKVDMPSGSVLQVVRATSTATTSTTSNSNVDLAGLAATITVQANSSILIHCTTGTYGPGGGGWGATGRVILTNSGNGTLAYGEHIGTISDEAQTHQHTFFHLVTGLSAGSYTYKLRGSSTTGGLIYFNRDSVMGGLVLMEIAG